MTQYQRSAAPRRRRRPAQMAAAIADEDNFGLEVQGRGLGRVFGVVLLMHLVGVGGIVAYKWVGKTSDTPVTVSDPSTVSPQEVIRPVSAPPEVEPRDSLGTDDILPPRQISGKPVVVDHPSMEGFKRYRVGEGEQLIEIVRQFNASVAEVEKINNLKPGDPLYTGQWLTIPDNTADGVVPVLSEDSKPIKARVIAAEDKPQPSKVQPVVESTPSSRAVPVPSSGGGKDYKVQRGDTAYGIARRHNVDWKELLAANGISDPLQLKAGQTIRIP